MQTRRLARLLHAGNGELGQERVEYFISHRLTAVTVNIYTCARFNATINAFYPLDRIAVVASLDELNSQRRIWSIGVVLFRNPVAGLHLHPAGAATCTFRTSPRPAASAAGLSPRLGQSSTGPQLDPVFLFVASASSSSSSALALELAARTATGPVLYHGRGEADEVALPSPFHQSGIHPTRPQDVNRGRVFLASVTACSSYLA
ncbi:hypothetical protein CDD80_6483 [Ophiocordyceps camponoti-rufipedis]|uniref:Uncharacterized protein n=1 Tax=Ophiocordyceps camponoti-rufipedis TaxID=2004952 RepID=A0A2C5ZHJ2_9HYPO|nr:hypothetical protein CDD80_6483 [Ophiocordyceps camponoti-rufipedis]